MLGKQWRRLLTYTTHWWEIFLHILILWSSFHQIDNNFTKVYWKKAVQQTYNGQILDEFIKSDKMKVCKSLKDLILE